MFEAQLKKRWRGEGLGSVAFPEHQWLQHSPNLVVCPVFTNNVSGVAISVDVEESIFFSTDCLPYTVIREGSPSFRQWRVWDGAACNYRLIIPKHDGVVNRDSHVMQR